MKEGYDLVIGSRYLDDAVSDDDTWLTGFGNWLFTKTINLLHGGNYTDAMVIYRSYRTKLIYDLELATDKPYSIPEKLFPSTFAVNVPVPPCGSSPPSSSFLHD